MSSRPKIKLERKDIIVRGNWDWRFLSRSFFSFSFNLFWLSEILETRGVSQWIDTHSHACRTPPLDNIRSTIGMRNEVSHFSHLKRFCSEIRAVLLGHEWVEWRALGQFYLAAFFSFSLFFFLAFAFIFYRAKVKQQMCYLEFVYSLIPTFAGPNPESQQWHQMLIAGSV